MFPLAPLSVDYRGARPTLSSRVNFPRVEVRKDGAGDLGSTGPLDRLGRGEVIWMNSCENLVTPAAPV